MAVDPITLEVVNEALITVVREMRASIIRASYSPVIYELDDFSCAIFNAKAELVAQSEDHPGHVLPMPWTVRFALEDLDDEIRPGDIIMVNDPYRGGTHLNDVTLIYPVFEDDELVLMPVLRTHWSDVGGMTPGSYSGLATNVFQEGLRMPALKIYEAGKVNQAVLSIIRANMRLPDHRMGDLQAMIGTCKTAEARLRQLFAKYGLPTLLACITANLDRCEARMREKIGDLPNGTYVHEDYLEYYDDGRFDPVLMRLALTIEDRHVIADFAGSNPQVPGVVNSSLAVAGAGIFVALKSTLDPGGAVNEGVFRAIELRAPKGSIVDARSDAPAGAHGEVRKRAVSVALGCLSQIAPELVSGDLCGTSFPNSIGGVSGPRKRAYVYYEVPAGGNGGFDQADGSSAFVNVDFGNIRSIHTAEHLETEMPLLVERSVLRTDSGGPGTQRGGLGLRREIRLLEDEATYSVLSDRAVIPPFGVLGGRHGAPVGVAIQNGETEARLPIPGKVTGQTIRQGDVVVMESAGGGGYGDPLARDPAAVSADVGAGYVSREGAERDYGVVLDDNGRPDPGATGRLRQSLAEQVIDLTVFLDRSDAYEGIKGRHRVLRLHPRIANGANLDDGQLVELVGRHPAPLRAWVRVDSGQRTDAIALDEFGCAALGVGDGDTVRLRGLPTLVRPGKAAVQ